jgi:outer membrane protein assembly factor BamB
VYGPPADWFYFVGSPDITVARSGRAYAAVEHCFAYPEGCLGYYDTIAVLQPDGGVRLFPLDATTEYLTAPVIGPDGTLYAGSESGLTALSPFGRVKWTYPGAVLPTLGSDGTIYAYAGPNLVALDPAGTVKWSTRLPDDPFTPLAVGPDGSFYYGSVDRHLTALTPTGDLKWRFFTGDQMHSPPSIAADGSVYAGGNELYALSPDGSLRWSYSSAGMSFSGATPALGADGTLYLSSAGAVVALNPDGTERWAYPRYGAAQRIILGGDGTLYTGWFAGIYDSGVLALSESGDLKWSLAVSYPDIVQFSASALGPDGTLYVMTSRKIYAIGASLMSGPAVRR